MKYRRAFTPGGTFFFTLVTDQRRPIFASNTAIDVLRDAIRTVRSQRPFTIDAMVVLPDHLHALWSLPPGDSDFSTRWRLIKTWFSKNCDPALRGLRNPARARKNGQAIWQQRFWEHQISDTQDYTRHIEYIHYNPVKHGLVVSPIEWAYSSFHRYVANGLYSADWGAGWVDVDGVGHE
jgi:putative transposase